jgi:hypothetical protein
MHTARNVARRTRSDQDQILVIGVAGIALAVFVLDSLFQPRPTRRRVSVRGPVEFPTLVAVKGSNASSAGRFRAQVAAQRYSYRMN